MSKTGNNNSGLPPKLNLSKKIGKPAGNPAVKLSPATKSGSSPAAAEPPLTSRIKLTPKADPKTKPLKLTPKAAAPQTPPAPATSTAPAAGNLKISSKTMQINPIEKPAPAAGIKMSSTTIQINPAEKPAPVSNTKISSKTVPITPTTVSPAPKTGTPAAAAGGGSQPTVRLKPKPKTAQTLTPKKSAQTEKKAPAKKPAPTLSSQKGPSNIKLKPKAAAGIKRTAVAPAAPADSKRSTSKIPLEAAAPAATAATNTRTIQINPAASPNKPGGKTAGPAGSPVSPDPKRQTSRISLESVLGTSEDTATPGAPKTIRLKRPAKSPAISINDAAGDNKKELGKTAKIEMPDESEVPATQKKTIKVKRPSQRRTAKKLSINRGGAAADAGAGAPQTSGIPIAPLSDLAPVQQADTTHWFFVVSAAAAMIVTFLIIYVYSAQAFGPNLSLTELSYGAPGVDLYLPGKITDLE